MKVRGTVLLILVVLILPLFVSSNTPVYIEHGNIFANYFKEPVERVVFIAIDGNSYSLTNFTESSVAINYDAFKELLKEDGYEIEHIVYVIHNHVDPSVTFSPADLQFYSILKSDGFNGLFLLWSSLRQRVTDWRYTRKETT